MKTFLSRNKILILIPNFNNPSQPRLHIMIINNANGVMIVEDFEGKIVNINIQTKQNILNNNNNKNNNIKNKSNIAQKPVNHIINKLTKDESPNIQRTIHYPYSRNSKLNLTHHRQKLLK